MFGLCVFFFLSLKPSLTISSPLEVSAVQCFSPCVSTHKDPDVLLKDIWLPGKRPFLTLLTHGILRGSWSGRFASLRLSSVSFLRFPMSLSVSDCCLLPPWPVFFFKPVDLFHQKNFNSPSPSDLNRNIRAISTVFTVFVKGFAITFTHGGHFQWPSWIKPPPICWSEDLLSQSIWLRVKSLRRKLCEWHILVLTVFPVKHEGFGPQKYAHFHMCFNDEPQADHKTPSTIKF